MTTTPPVSGADVAISASFDRSFYTVGQPVNVTVRVVNNADVDATGVRVTASGTVDTAGQWGDFGEGPGATIAAHGAREVVVVGTFSPDSTWIYLSLEVTSESGDTDSWNNHTTISANVVRATARFGGAVFEDRDGDGLVDDGEGVYGAQITVWGATSSTYQSVYTGFGGRFDFGDLPEGEYSVDYGSYGYTLYGVGGAEGHELLTLTEERYADVRIMAKPALRSVLNPRLSFDGVRYSAGDTATGKISLTNTAQRDLTGVTATCQGFGSQLEVNLGGLVPGGSGVGVPAAATISVPISGAVPADADRHGEFVVSCVFSATGYSASGGPSAYAIVPVNGVPATGRGTLVDITTYSPVPDMPVVLLDRDTGQSVARTVSDANGSFVFTEVPAGSYDVRIEGPWLATNGYRFDIHADNNWASSVYLTPDQANQGRIANLKATVAFDKTHYESHEPVRATLTISNIGNADATDVRMWTEPGSNFWPDRGGWGELDAGVTIEAGATRTFEYTGAPLMWQSVPSAVVFSGTLWSPSPDSNFDNNRFYVGSSWTVVRSDYSGIVYADKNGNGRPDRGEGMDGVHISASGGRPYGGAWTTTDSDGRFVMPQLVLGDYQAYVSSNNEDWVIEGTGVDRFTLTRAGRAVELRAVPALRRTLKADLRIEKDTYGKGDIAKSLVTLTNTGSTSLTGINAQCWAHEGWLDTSEGWSPIGEFDPGADLAPGAKKTFEVLNKISDEDYRVGTHDVWCVFVADGHSASGAPNAGDTAAVVGAVGTRSGSLVHDANSDWSYTDDERLAGITVQLVDTRTGKAVGQTVTDAAGQFTFADRPVGPYKIHVVGPWQPYFGDWATRLPVTEGTDPYVPTFLMVPGPDQPPVGS